MTHESILKSLGVHQEVLEAQERLRTSIRETPLEFSLVLSQLSRGDVFLKCENLQITGSFKLRGAANKLLSLSDEERGRGILTASSGNHGAAVAYLLQKLNMSGTIFLPENASSVKIEMLNLYGADIQLVGSDCIQAEMDAKHRAERNGHVYISPYNDVKVIGGQGTVAVEIVRQSKRIDAVLVPVGAGGLISGIGGYLKTMRPEIKIIGCQPENSAVMAESIKAGRILDIPSQPTLSDGTAGGVEQGALTFGICKEVVDDFILVSEEEIGEALRLVIQNHHMLIEGAAALSVAGFIKEIERFKGQTVVLVLSGAKLSLSQLKTILK